MDMDSYQQKPLATPPISAIPENSSTKLVTGSSCFPLSQTQFISTLAGVALLFVACPRLFSLRREDVKVIPNPIRFLKLGIATILILLHSILFIVDFDLKCSTIFIAIAALNSVVSFVVLVLSQLEHIRSLRPSSILQIYLLSSILDFIATLEMSVIDNYSSILGLQIAIVCCKLALWALECLNKGPLLRYQYQHLAPESTSGIINRSFLWWLNGLFVEGYKKLLRPQDLFPLDQTLATNGLGEKIQKEWDLVEMKSPSSAGRFALVYALYRSIGQFYAFVILPRICLIAFTFAQPSLITEVLEFLQTGREERLYTSCNLIVAAGIIYLGIAISSLHSSHNLYRFITMFRSATIALIYSHTLRVEEGKYDEAAAVSLMSTDVDQISFCLEELNECWSRLIEMAIGIALLTQQVGWISVVPLLVVFLSTAGSSIITSMVGDKLKSWADATQKRLEITGSALTQMKSIKMMGLDSTMSANLRDQRWKETKLMEKYAWVVVFKNVIANAPIVLAPAATFAVYAIEAKIRGTNSLDTTKAFTSLALIMLVSDPCSRLLCAIPNVAASVGCFDRIQNFLLSKPAVDKKSVLDGDQNGASFQIDPPIVGLISVSDSPTHLLPPPLPQSLMVFLEAATTKYNGSEAFGLGPVTLKAWEGSITFVTGAVGSGKSTLLKIVLGEIDCNQGTVYVRTKHLGYCSQTPWLPNGTIRKAVTNFIEDDLIDEKWYQTVIETCALGPDIASFLNGDQTVYGSRGIALSGGQKHRIALARALYHRPKIFILDDIFSALDKATAATLARRLFMTGGVFQRLKSTVIIATHSLEYLPLADQVMILTDEGRNIYQGTFEDMKNAGFVTAEKIRSGVSIVIPEKPVTDPESRINQIVLNNEASDLTRQTGDIAVYMYYFKTVGFSKLIIFVMFCLLNVFSSSFSGIWLEWWTERDGHQMGLYISVYFLLALGYIIGMGGYAWAIAVSIGPSSGRSLHQKLLDTVMRAPQAFFSGSEIGSILSRFSQDMTLIEGQLSIGVLATVSNLFASLAEAALVVTGSTYMVITIPFLLATIYLLQRVYLRTSRQLRFLDLETRSPLYSHFLETLEGVSTIRAFGWQQECTRENHRRLDASQQPYYLLFCIQRWLTLVLDLICGAMAVVVIALATNWTESTSPGFLGVSLNNILAFNGSISAFIAGWTLLETSLGAISRLRDFEANTEVEAKEGEDTEPPENWPSRGLVEIKGISAKYSSSTVAFRDLTMKISPGQKVGICGRTGSGKSSLFSAILRMLNISSGTIEIDGVDLSTIPRTIIRSRLSTIPQDGLHLPSSFRFNIDPYSANTNEQIIIALKKVGLWDTVSQRGGLNADLTSDSLSQGQRQLLALARALLRKSKVVLLDEVMSSIDRETEKLLQNVMKEEFRDSTVITIAHRLEIVLDCDMVGVMSKGSLVEFGEPCQLMEDKKSALSRLWRGGEEDVDDLIDIGS